MQAVTCPFCKGKIYSSYFPDSGKVRCIHCKKEFFIGYDELKHACIATDPKSPIQAIFISGKKKDKS